MLAAIWRVMKENFFIHLSITFFNPKILGFLFLTKNSLAWGVNCEKIKFQKIVGNLIIR